MSPNGEVVDFSAEFSVDVEREANVWPTSASASGVLGTGTPTMSGGLVSVAGTLSTGTYGARIFNRSDASAYSGIIYGTGAVTNQGDGTLTLTGSNGHTGANTPANDIDSLCRHLMSRCGWPARRAVPRPVCADKETPASSRHGNSSATPG